MADYLLQFCVDKEIELFYTNKSSPVLSSYVQYGIRNIVAYNIFRECSKELAAAVVNYYTQDKDREINLDKILEFLKQYFKSGILKIDSIEVFLDEKVQKHSDSEISRKISESIPEAVEKSLTNINNEVPETNHKQKTQRKRTSKNNETSTDETQVKPKTSTKKKSTSKKTKKEVGKNNIVEVDIKNITKKSFKGNTTEVQSNDAIKVDDGDIVELDITIDPFNT